MFTQTTVNAILNNPKSRKALHDAIKTTKDQAASIWTKTAHNVVKNRHGLGYIGVIVSDNKIAIINQKGQNITNMIKKGLQS